MKKATTTSQTNVVTNNEVVTTKNAPKFSHAEMVKQEAEKRAMESYLEAKRKKEQVKLTEVTTTKNEPKMKVEATTTTESTETTKVAPAPKVKVKAEKVNEQDHLGVAINDIVTLTDDNGNVRKGQVFYHRIIQQTGKSRSRIYFLDKNDNMTTEKRSTFTSNLTKTTDVAKVAYVKPVKVKEVTPVVNEVLETPVQVAEKFAPTVEEVVVAEKTTPKKNTKKA